jgi:hypothetical protein
MIKKIITLLLLVAFATHTFSRVMIVVGFYANQEQIAATLCENKDKPVLKCAGKCQLSKKLKSEQKADQQNPERKMENKPEDLSSRSFYSSLSIAMNAGASNTQTPADSGKPVHRSFAIFHPPITPVHFA